MKIKGAALAAFIALSFSFSGLPSYAEKPAQKQIRLFMHDSTEKLVAAWNPNCIPPDKDVISVVARYDKHANLLERPRSSSEKTGNSALALSTKRALETIDQTPIDDPPAPLVGKDIVFLFDARPYCLKLRTDLALAHYSNSQASRYLFPFWKRYPEAHQRWVDGLPPDVRKENRWAAELDGLKDGPYPVHVGGQSMIITGACKPHLCPLQAWVLFTSDQHRLVGQMYDDRRVTLVVGRPTAAEVKCLNSYALAGTALKSC